MGTTRISLEPSQLQRWKKKTPGIAEGLNAVAVIAKARAQGGKAGRRDLGHTSESNVTAEGTDDG